MENIQTYHLLQEQKPDIWNDSGYKEALYFEILSESKFGFTIAGTITYKKTTLLSVSFRISKNFPIILWHFFFNYRYSDLYWIILLFYHRMEEIKWKLTWNYTFFLIQIQLEVAFFVEILKMRMS
jgi:hypothetical protein